MLQLRSWAPLQRETTIKLMTQYKITYFLTILKTSEYYDYKKYIDISVETIEYLEWPYIVHVDEQV